VAPYPATIPEMFVLTGYKHYQQTILTPESCADPSREDLNQHSLAVFCLVLAIKRLSATKQRYYVIEGGHLCLVCE
jgi:hypothetical protein